MATIEKTVDFEIIENDYSKILKISTEDYIDSFVTFNPTDNCQLASFGAFDEILEGLDYHEEEDSFNKRELLSYIIKEVCKLSYKRLFLIDITENVYKRHKTIMKSVFEKINIKRYTSTNGSSMVLCLCEVKKNN